MPRPLSVDARLRAHVVHAASPDARQQVPLEVRPPVSVPHTRRRRVSFATPSFPWSLRYFSGGGVRVWLPVFVVCLCRLSLSSALGAVPITRFPCLLTARHTRGLHTTCRRYHHGWKRPEHMIGVTNFAFDHIVEVWVTMSSAFAPILFFPINMYGWRGRVHRVIRLCLCSPLHVPGSPLTRVSPRCFCQLRG